MQVRAFERYIPLKATLRLYRYSVDMFSRLFRGRNSCRCFCVELVKLILVHRYSVANFFSYSGPSGIFGSDGKQNT